MREIEVKAKAENHKALLENARKMGIQFGEPIFQEDITYESKLPYDHPDWNIFRIRKQGDDTILTMKYKASDRSHDNHERETKIEDATQVVDMLARVGYVYGVRVAKHRRKAKHNGLELCLDEVEGLGTFVEVEKLTDEDDDVEMVQTELWGLLLQLGVSPENRLHKGYDILMHEFINSSPQR